MYIYIYIYIYCYYITLIFSVLSSSSARFQVLFKKGAHSVLGCTYMGRNYVDIQFKKDTHAFGKLFPNVAGRF